MTAKPIVGRPPTSVVLRRICEPLMRALPTFGVSVSILADGGHEGTAFASNERAARLDGLQFTLGEGPGLDAVGDQVPVLLADLSDDSVVGLTRWPAFVSAARAEGVEALFAFPLVVGVSAFGMMTVHAPRPYSLSKADLTLVLRAADAATRVLLDLIDGDGEIGDRLDDGDACRAQVYQASGVLMAQLEVGSGEALARLRAYAYAQNRDINDVAEDVLAHRLRLTNDYR
jgi:ANTAR domain/GAF domain